MSAISNAPDSQQPEMQPGTGETTPPPQNLSLIESVGTEEPEFNSSEGLSQSTPVQVMERQIT